MNFPIHTDTISMGLPIVSLRGQRLLCISVPEDCLILANSAGHDEMQHYAAFHHGHHSLPKNRFRGFQYTLRVNVDSDKYTRG